MILIKYMKILKKMKYKHYQRKKKQNIMIISQKVLKLVLPQKIMIPQTQIMEMMK